MTASRANGTTACFTYTNSLPTRCYTPLIQDYSLNYDYQSGNVLDRYDNIKGLHEAFLYDNVNRLGSSTASSATSTWTPQTVTYDVGGPNISNGNIANKCDIGNYQYFDKKPHAVSFIENAAGNIPLATQDVTYTPFQKAASFQESGNVLVFSYGYDYQRRKTELYNGAILKEWRLYIGNGYEEHYDPTTITSSGIYYISGPDGLAVIYRIVNGSPTSYYPYTDHLGSITTLTDKLGNIVYEQAFDPWGLYRKAADWNANDGPNIFPPVQWLWLRGYTGQEHMTNFRAINMNGRIYDPLIARVFSPDNFIQSAGNTQSYNRFSYCWNNPMRYNDPSGNILGVALYGVAYLGSLGSNFIYGDSRPFAHANASATQAVNEVGSVGQFQLYNNGYTNVTGGLNILCLGVGLNYSYHDGDFSANASVGIGLSGPYAGANIHEKFHLGENSSIALNAGASTNFSTYNYSGGFSGNAGDFYYGYSFNTYGGARGDGYGAQNTGTITLGVNDFSVSHENDFNKLTFGHGGDKYRTAALNVSVGPFSVGANISTNDPLSEFDPGGKRITEAYRADGKSKIYGENHSEMPDVEHGFKSWGEYGKVFSSPLYAQYKNNGMVSRVGYSFSAVQDRIQNGMHQWHFFPAGNQNYYLNYTQFKSGIYGYAGAINTMYER